MTSQEAARVRELEQDDRELRWANEILKRAASFSGGRSSAASTGVLAFMNAHRDDVVEGRRLGIEPTARVLRDAGLMVTPSSYYAAKTPRPASARSARDAGLRPAFA